MKITALVQSQKVASDRAAKWALYRRPTRQRNLPPNEEQIYHQTCRNNSSVAAFAPYSKAQALTERLGMRMAFVVL